MNSERINKRELREQIKLPKELKTLTQKRKKKLPPLKKTQQIRGRNVKRIINQY